jgi:hypothetical protein
VIATRINLNVWACAIFGVTISWEGMMSGRFNQRRSAVNFAFDFGERLHTVETPSDPKPSSGFAAAICLGISFLLFECQYLEDVRKILCKQCNATALRARNTPNADAWAPGELCRQLIVIIESERYL